MYHSTVTVFSKFAKDWCQANQFKTCLFSYQKERFAFEMKKENISLFISQRIKGYLYQSRKNEETTMCVSNLD